MPDDEAHQLARDVSGPAQHECRRAGAHSAATGGAAALSTPTLAMTLSPSAAPSVIALNAATFICSLMICTPTWLSVEGPVTTHGSMPNFSRSSLTPPHAATGSLAESTRPVMALRMSSHLRIASTP